MTFLNPWMLWGAAAVASPLIIHLLMRRRVRPMRWAAMRFIEAVVRRNESRLRLENLLLLLMRCALLILLALAMARPALESAAGLAQGGARTLVLALDNSASMGASDGTPSRFENAKKAALRMLDDLPAGSSAALLVYSDAVTPLIPEPSRDLGLVRKLVHDAKLTGRGSNAHPAVTAAQDILRRHGGGEALLLTDAQAAGWRELGAMRTEASGGRGPAGRFIILIPSPLPPGNMAVTDLAMMSPFAPAGVATRFSVRVSNHGPAEARDVPVSLAIDAEPPGDQAVIPSIPPHESRRVPLFARPRAAGFHTITARIPADALAADDTRGMVVHVMDQVRVLLVAGYAGEKPRDGDAFFLERALAPVPEEAQASWFIKPRIIAPEDLAGVDLADFDAVALLDVPRVEPAAEAALEKFVRQGGGVMIFPGDRMDATSYAALLPARYGKAWSLARDGFKVLQTGGYTHPVAALWQDPAAGTLATAHFYKGMTIEKPDAHGIILSYADGTPAVVEGALGAGRVIQFSSSGNAAWNDLPAHPAYVPLMQRALGRLVASRDETLNLACGTTFLHTMPEEWLARVATVTPPHGAAPIQAVVARTGTETALRFAETDQAGTYAVTVQGMPPASLAFAARMPPEESDLEPLPDADLRSLAPDTRVIHWQAGSADVPVGAGRGRELWDILVVLALLLACCETFVAGRFSAAK